MAKIGKAAQSQAAAKFGSSKFASGFVAATLNNIAGRANMKTNWLIASTEDSDIEPSRRPA